MEREILFRARRKDNGKWIEGLTLFKPDEHLYMFQTVWGEITYDLHYNITAILGGKKPFFVEVIPETVGRFTGLCDKNGTKIFEGDIVEWGFGFYVTVEYIKEYARFVGVNGDSIFGLEDTGNKNRVEIVGNIHNNPELLK